MTFCRFSLGIWSKSFTIKAFVGQAVTHAGKSNLWQRSHLTARCLLTSLVTTPNGQTIKQVQHPIQRSFLRLINPFSSLYRHPLMHAFKHGASSQWRQRIGIFMLPAVSTNNLFIGAGISNSAENNVFPSECWTAQAISQLLHPMHLSGLTYIASIIALPLF